MCSMTLSSGVSAIRHRSALPGARAFCFGFEFLAGLVQVDLLYAALQRDAASGEFDALHAEYALVKVDRALDVSNG